MACAATARILCRFPLHGNSFPYCRRLVSTVRCAVPFKLSRDEALQAFHKSHESLGALCTTDLTSFTAVPVYLPFYMFQARMSAVFDGSLGYWFKEDKLAWYVQKGIKLELELLSPTTTPEIAFYAGSIYQRASVEKALVPTCLSEVKPLAEHIKSTSEAKVYDFEVDQASASRQVQERLSEAIKERAKSYLMEKPPGEFVLETPWLHILMAGQFFIDRKKCPSADNADRGKWMSLVFGKGGPNRVEVDNMKLSPCKLHDYGLIYLPAWIVRSASQGGCYIVNAHNGLVSMPIMDW